MDGVFGEEREHLNRENRKHHLCSQLALTACDILVPTYISLLCIKGNWKQFTLWRRQKETFDICILE